MAQQRGRQAGSARLQSRGTLSRRGFLVLVAAGTVAACGQSRTALPAVATATVPRPAGAITSQNSAQLRPLASFDPQDGKLRGVAWSPDSRIVAVGGQGDVQLWDTTTGKPAGTWRGHHGQIHGMAWSPVAGLLVTASVDGTIRLWSFPSGETVRVLQGAGSATFACVAWSPDATRIIGGTQEGVLSMWNAATGEQLASWLGPARKREVGDNPYAVWGAAWSPDGKRIASTRYDFHLLITEVASGRQIKVLETDSQPNGICWSADGHTLVSSHDDGSILVWDATQYTLAATLRDPSDYVWTYPMMWASGRTLLAAGGGDGVVRVWDTSSHKELAALRGHAAGVWDVAWSPDQRWLASASDDGTLRLWGL